VTSDDQTEGGLYPPVPPGHTRLFEFLHGYEDVPNDELERRRLEMESDPLCQILMDEINKAVDRELIGKIVAEAKRDLTRDDVEKFIIKEK